MKIRILGLMLLWCLPGLAQESGVAVGNMTLFPTLGLALGHDDNLALSESDPISSIYRLIEPGIRAELSGQRTRLRAQYRLSDASFEDSPLDDYTDQFLDLGLRYTPSIRSDFQLNGYWNRAHDRRGEGLRENFLSTLDREVDQFDEHGLGFRYQYGAEGARGRLALFADANDKQYRNNRDFTRDGDFQRKALGAEFGWRLGARTTALLKAELGRFDYDLADRDNRERRAAVGLLWDGTPRSSARVLVGRLTRTPDNSEQADFAGAFWEVGLTYRPVDRSEFSLLSGRDTDEAFGGASFLVRERTSLGWRHQWRSQLATSVDLGWTQEDLRPNQRRDDLYQVGLSVDYAFRRWMLLGMGYQRVERRSSNALFDYRSNQILVTAQISL